MRTYVRVFIATHFLFYTGDDPEQQQTPAHLCSVERRGNFCQQGYGVLHGQVQFATLDYLGYIDT